VNLQINFGKPFESGTSTLEHPQLFCTISLKAERGGKTWIAVQANRRKAYIQASFIGWNLILEGFLGGLVTGFGMFCFGKTLSFGRTTFSWLQVTGLQDDWGCSYIGENHAHHGPVALISLNVHAFQVNFSNSCTLQLPILYPYLSEIHRFRATSLCKMDVVLILFSCYFMCRQAVERRADWLDTEIFGDIYAPFNKTAWTWLDEELLCLQNILGSYPNGREWNEVTSHTVETHTSAWDPIHGHPYAKYLDLQAA
jgi:hypothetical protein